LIIGFSLIIISFLFVTITEFNEFLAKFDYVGILVVMIGFILIASSSSSEKINNYNKYLASTFYFIGHDLEQNSDIQSEIYIGKMGKHLKNCDRIINTIDNSLRGGIYVKNTSNYINQLNKFIKLLNGYYVNHPKYDIDKADITQQIIQLADLIHNDNGCITDGHIKLIDLLCNDLTKHDVKEKSLYVSKTEKIRYTYKSITNGIPYNFRLLIYIVLIMFVAYYSINYMALSKDINQDAAFGFAVTGSIAALVPALMIKDYIIK